MNMWTEIHTAMLVGREGTVRAAAERLGIHRATVSRHIDTLEENMETKLFLRHQHGYTPTAVGRKLLHSAERAELAIGEFHEFLQTSAHDLVGRLTISAVSNAAPIIRGATKLYCDAHPGVRVRFNPTVELPKLELYGSHIALSAGKKPDHPDYVVIPYFSFPIGLYAHRSYLEQYGVPKDLSELYQHKFVGSSDVLDRFDASPQYGEFIREENVVLETNDPSVVLDGILSGIGIGFTAQADAASHEDLVEVLTPDQAVVARVWIVTHMDVHRTRLIQEFVSCLKACSPTASAPIHHVSSRPPTILVRPDFESDSNGEYRDAS